MVHELTINKNNPEAYQIICIIYFFDQLSNVQRLLARCPIGIVLHRSEPSERKRLPHVIEPPPDCPPMASKKATNWRGVYTSQLEQFPDWDPLRRCAPIDDVQRQSIILYDVTLPLHPNRYQYRNQRWPQASRLVLARPQPPASGPGAG